MTSQDTYDYLTAHGVSFEKMEHAPVFNMEELEALNLPHSECDAKNLFIRDDKKKNYYLITVKGDKHVNLKEFRKAHSLRNLSFASSEDLMDILGLIPGAVTPLGLLADDARRVTFYFDRAFLGGLVGVHPNDNAASVWMQAEDLIRIIEEHGNTVHLVDL